MIHVLRGALYCIVRDIRLLIIVAVLIALSFVPASDAFSRVSTFSEENLDTLSSAYGHRSESLEEFKQWFRSEHFVDFSFRKTFENASLTTALCCLALGVYFFGMSAHSRNFNGAIYAGIPRRKQITATLLLYLVVTLIVTSLPTLIVFTFYALVGGGCSNRDTRSAALGTSCCSTPRPQWRSHLYSCSQRVCTKTLASEFSTSPSDLS